VTLFSVNIHKYCWWTNIC